MQPAVKILFFCRHGKLEWEVEQLSVSYAVIDITGDLSTLRIIIGQENSLGTQIH